MKNLILGATAVLAVVALFFSFNSVFHIRSQACRDALNICVQQCDNTRDRALGENQLRRSQINFELTRALLDCRIDNFGNDDAINQCQRAKTDAAAEELAALDRLDNAIREVRQQCVTECNNQAKKCDGRLPTRIDTTPDINVPAEIDCLEGGAPCVKPVLEICTVITGPCDDCWKSLCGGGDWSFESSVPLEVTLIAATDPTKNAHVLATSSMKGKQAVLSVPADIKLNEKERLYFGFSSKEKPGGPVKVLIHRGR
jgi:hypothetical protein